jgi:hypothetical protein
MVRPDDWLSICQRSYGFVSFRRQQQPFQVAPEPITLIALGEQRIEVLGIGFEGRGCGCHGQRLSHDTTSRFGYNMTTMPVSTNYR